MEHIMEQYGKAILTGVVLIALGVIVVALIKNAWMTQQFQNALTNFFSNMNGIGAGNAPTWIL